LFWATDANLEVLVAGDFFCFRATDAYQELLIAGDMFLIFFNLVTMHE